MTEASTTARAGRREWIGLAVLGLPTLLVAMDFSILYLATPHLTADLKPSGVQQLWIIDIYGFVIAGGSWSPWGPSVTCSAGRDCC